MIKVVTLSNRKPGMSHEEFAEYWLRIHAPKAKKLPGLRKYTINVLSSEGEEGAYDGLAELWFDDMDAWKRALESPEGREAGKDGDNFVGKMLLLYAEEHKII